MGRELHLAELNRHLMAVNKASGPRILLLDGAAGMGKTTLALGWAHRVRDQFPDGVMYADLRGFDAHSPAVAPTEILNRFVQDLGVPAADVPDGLDARMALLRTLADGRRLLILLDNAADYEQIRPLLSGSTGALVMITSRSRMPGLIVREGARRVEVGPFTCAESCALLQGVVESFGVDIEATAAADIAELCENHPLALRIVAFRLATNTGLTISRVIGELQSTDRRLEVLETADDSAGIRGALSWSYRRLPDRAAWTFGLLGLNPGNTFSAAAAAALTGQELAATHRQLRLLADQHLIEEVRPDRFRMHNLVHAYAAECGRQRISRAERDAAIERLSRWCADAANRAEFHRVGRARSNGGVIGPPSAGGRATAVGGRGPAVLSRPSFVPAWTGRVPWMSVMPSQWRAPARHADTSHRGPAGLGRRSP